MVGSPFDPPPLWKDLLELVAYLVVILLWCVGVGALAIWLHG